jgi:hypothetical protein
MPVLAAPPARAAVTADGAAILLQPFWTASDLASIRPRAPLAALQPRVRRAQVAQLVEHVTENHGVGGSIPPLGTKEILCKFNQLKEARASLERIFALGCTGTQSVPRASRAEAEGRQLGLRSP